MHCCEAFARETKELSPMPGGIGVYYGAIKTPTGQIEQDKEDGSWNVNGCCGGGCYVLENIKYCPFCGTKLPTKGNTK